MAELIRELHDETFGDTAPQINPEEGWWWIAFDVEESRDIAGFLGMVPSYGSPKSIAYFQRVGVVDRHKGRGLQRRLMRAMEAKARRLGFKTIVTDTSDNPPSANNLIACGYLTYHPPEPWGFNHTIYWSKDL
jgi:GNAT superfamily N-acetyltransferase